MSAFSTDNLGGIYEFGRFRVDAEERLLFDGGAPVNLPPKIFDTLLLLVANAGRAIPKNEMMEIIWPDSFVEENNLAQNISFLRRTFGNENNYIETVPKRGYRFIGLVTVKDGDVQTTTFERTTARVSIVESDEIPPLGERPSALTSFPVPVTHYVQNGDVNLAYQVVGNGPVDVVFVMGWISHLEYFWKHHLFASFLERLASFSRLILFDKRGTGLSDRVPIDQLPTLEQRMEDVHAVMNAVGSQRAVLIGVSEGGPMCSLFAATYPELTSALVMIGTYAKRIHDDDYPWAPTAAQREAFFDVMRRDWGKPVGIEERAPSLAADAEFRDWWATYLRMGASPGAAVALTKMNAQIDVRSVLPSIRVPTLVLHRTDDKCLKVEEGRYVASKIAGSRYVEFPGDDHLPFVGNQAEILDEIESFVAEVQQGIEQHDRVLATVMNIRIADFKIEAGKRDSGDWRLILKQARETVARQLELFRGKEVSYNEKGSLATFDGPARAIRCAKAIAEAAAVLGVRVKTGLHTGECDVVNGVYSGFAVDLAQKITEESEPDNILVSRTVKDLVAGSGLEFDELGIRRFDGIDGEWRLFTVRN